MRHQQISHDNDNHGFTLSVCLPVSWRRERCSRRIRRMQETLADLGRDCVAPEEREDRLECFGFDLTQIQFPPPTKRI